MAKTTQWLSGFNSGFPGPFRFRERITLSRHERWQREADLLGLSREAKVRLEWMVFYETKGAGDVTATCRHFGIARKTFYDWHRRFGDGNLRALEERSRAPKQTRQKEHTSLQYERIVGLRRAHICYGKQKLLWLYRLQYPEDTEISSWKVQCIIEKAGIYHNPKKQGRINRKRRRSVKRKKITDLEKKKVTGFLLCMDTIVIYWKSTKRYILTGIDRHSKVAYARMYTTHTSASASDFLHRIHYLLDGKVENVQTDNGSEFHKHFETTCKDLNIPHWWSRVHTPKDNAVNERFNRTLQEEFIQLGNMTDNATIFNRNLTEWLVEYNFRRPHQTLGYVPPMNFSYKFHKVLPMYPSSTSY